VVSGLGRYPIGSILQIVPHHSCAATKAHRVMHAVEADNDTIVDSYEICHGW
jgi:D-serine deaminase-like pyridoxal phosphate-dependent protein